jgi:Flp pilus assembly secretin CpaC
MRLRRTIGVTTIVLGLPLCAHAQEEPAPPERVERNLARKPFQVEVSVKVIEFQSTKGLETGLSAYFQKLPRAQPFGRVSISNNAINTADLTFPSSTASGITVFLDRIMLTEGDIELVLQALVNENRAFILSQPRAMALIGAGEDSIVKTAQQIPYENTQVVGVVAQQITDFKDTGVTLTVQATEIIDDDLDWNTREDTWVRLTVNAQVLEEGQRITIALDDQLASGGTFDQSRNEIRVPEFVSRSIDTQVWVGDGDVLILGGLYRNTESRTLTTVPWLTQAEDFAVSAAQQFIPGNFLTSPLSAVVGNRTSSDSRRELVFLIKCDVWEATSAFSSDLAFEEDDAEGLFDRAPGETLSDIIQGITNLPGSLQGAAPDEKSVDQNLGSKEN